MIELKEALIGRKNATKASIGTRWVTRFKKKDIVPGTIAKIYDEDEGESVYLYVPACELTRWLDQFIRYDKGFPDDIHGWFVKNFDKNFPRMDTYSDVVIKAISDKPVDITSVTTALDVKNILEKMVR